MFWEKSKPKSSLVNTSHHSYKRLEKNVQTSKTIVLFEDENMIVFTPYTVFDKFQKIRTHSLLYVPEEEIILKAVEDKISSDSEISLNLEAFLNEIKLIRRYDYLFAAFLAKKQCIIYDKIKNKFITEIKIIEESSVEGPTCGAGGRKFYANDNLILKTLDWIS